MRRIVLLSILASYFTVNFAQVEIPKTETNCKLMNTHKFWYCINDSNYQTVWTAIKIEKTDIENHQFFPPDKDFFPGLAKSGSIMWKKLEDQVKYWAIEFDSVFVVTGNLSIYDSVLDQPRILFYKAILKGCKGDEIGFIINDEQVSVDLISYAVPVDSIEKITGFDFFPTLSPELQNIIESEFNSDFWPVSIP
jgi:DNA/RNA endonuclease G (NUC1)